MLVTLNIGIHCTLCHNWQIWHTSHSVGQRMHVVPILESDQSWHVIIDHEW